MNFKLQSDFGDLVTTSRQVSMPKLSGPDLAKLRADVLEVMRKPDSQILARADHHLHLRTGT